LPTLLYKRGLPVINSETIFGDFMSQFIHQRISVRRLSIFFLLVGGLLTGSLAQAEGVFDNRSKAGHALSGAELQRIKREHETRYGKIEVGGSYNTTNPWERQKQSVQSNRGNWGECRDNALNLRNICYKQGRNAYDCERVYEARAELCDTSL
jgi:hypothetical protein